MYWRQQERSWERMQLLGGRWGWIGVYLYGKMVLIFWENYLV